MRRMLLTIAPVALLAGLLWLVPIMGQAEEVEELRQLAEKGDAEAQYRLGRRHTKGDGVAYDLTIATQWFLLAERQGLDAAKRELAKIAAFEKRLRAAERGEGTAKYKIGRMYLQGEGIPKNEIEAKKWFDRAADKRHYGAKKELGRMARLERTREAAEAGDAEAQRKLGLIYLVGEGVVNDQKEGVQWLRLSIEQESDELKRAEGLAKLEKLVKNPSDLRPMKGWAKEELANIEKMENTRRAALDGDGQAQYRLGMMYLTGFAVSQNALSAKHWFVLASEQGNSEAARELHKMEELERLRVSAENGDMAAQSKLGSLYAKGQGVTQDSKEAEKWYRLAAEQGDPYCQFRLGSMYEQGVVVPKDHVQALMWYQLAIKDDAPIYDKRIREMLMKKMTEEQIKQAQELVANWKPKAATPEPVKEASPGLFMSSPTGQAKSATPDLPMITEPEPLKFFESVPVNMDEVVPQ